MAAASEQISVKWLRDAERVCVRCGSAIKNLVREVGSIDTLYEGRREVSTKITCMTCTTRRR